MFSRKQTLQPGRLDLNEVVARTSRLLRRVIGDNITLEVVAAAGLPVRLTPESARAAQGVA